VLLFHYVTEEAGRKCVWDMPSLPAAECNMITNKQTLRFTPSRPDWALVGNILPNNKRRGGDLKTRWADGLLQSLA